MEHPDLISLGIKQGSIVSSTLSPAMKELVENSRSLIKERKKPVNDNCKLLIISQDCDIDNKNIYHIELAVIQKAKPKDAQTLHLRKTRNLRKLVILIDNEYWLIKSEQISCIPKQDLYDAIDKTDIDILSNKNLQIFIKWLINKYGRRPFPSSFNDEFLRYLWNTENGIMQFLELHYANILEIYVYVDPKDDTADTYNVIVTALLSEECCEQTALEISDELSEFWHSLNETNTVLTMLQCDETAIIPIQIENMAFAVAPEDFTKKDEFNMNPILLDYLCWPDE